jgi:hypothetical protein
MVRSTLAKVMWVGKATVFMIGLAMIMALDECCQVQAHNSLMRP